MQTVNLLASVSVGSTPSLPTFRLLRLKVRTRSFQDRNARFESGRSHLRSRAVAAHWVHNPEVTGSNPVSATLTFTKRRNMKTKSELLWLSYSNLWLIRLVGYGTCLSRKHKTGSIPVWVVYMIPKCVVLLGANLESYFRTGCVQFWNCSVLQDMNKANRTSEYNTFSYSSVGRASGC